MIESGIVHHDGTAVAGVVERPSVDSGVTVECTIQDGDQASIRIGKPPTIIAIIVEKQRINDC